MANRFNPSRCLGLLVSVLFAGTLATTADDQRPGLTWSQLPSLPDAVGFAGPFAGTSGGALLVGGGANFPEAMPWEGGRKVWHDRVFVLTDPADIWRTGFELPRPLAYGVSVSTAEGVLCAGGSDAQEHHREVFLLRWTGDRLTIESLPPLPHPVANACAARLGNTVYVAGGLARPDATNALHNFWALDLTPPASSWRELEPWPGPARMLAVAAAQSGAFYLVSGAGLSGDAQGKPVRAYLRDAYRFTPGAGWKRIADLPHPTVAAPSPAPTIGQSHFVVLGGDTGAAVGFEPPAQHPGFSATALAYHTITDTWVPFGDLPAPRVTAPVVEWRGRFHVLSGETHPGRRSPEVWSTQVVGARTGFGWLNSATLVLYLVAMVWIGSSFARRNRTTDDFFRGGQRIPWWAAGLSIFATMLSSITFMAIPAQSYSVGWNLFLANSYLLLTPLIVAVYLPFYRRLDVTSAYEYLERRFNTATRLLASALFILFQLGRVAIVLYLPSLALAAVSNLDVSLCIVVMGGLCITYTVLGGIEAVIWTDAAQAIILLGGALVALLTLVGRVDGGWAEVLSTAAAQGRFFESVPWNFDYTVGAAGIIIVGSLFTNLFPYTASQDVVQRYVTTADQRAAARAIWLNALLSPVAQALFFVIGTALFAFYVHHPERLDPTLQTDAIFPLFIVRELPAGLAGLLVAALFAAAQSTLGSSLNSVATAYVTDFHRRFRRTTSDAACLRLARWLTAGVGLAGTGAALVLAQSDVRSVWETFIAIISLFGGTVSGLFALGIFSRRSHGPGALIGAVLSGLLVVGVKVFTPAHFFCYAVVGVLSCVVFGWLASRVWPAPARDLRGLTLWAK
ncbi:MAG: sodium/solute symporter [Verrucomicrobiales bacterium]|nr:sodium/solute symporter [Verrucomicrobiales bacterium]